MIAKREVDQRQFVVAKEKCQFCVINNKKEILKIKLFEIAKAGVRALNFLHTEYQNTFFDDSNLDPDPEISLVIVCDRL